MTFPAILELVLNESSFSCGESLLLAEGVDLLIEAVKGSLQAMLGRERVSIDQRESGADCSGVSSSTWDSRASATEWGTVIAGSGRHRSFGTLYRLGGQIFGSDLIATRARPEPTHCEDLDLIALFLSPESPQTNPTRATRLDPGKCIGAGTIRLVGMRRSLVSLTVS